jgi:hypothetical protein
MEEIILLMNDLYSGKTFMYKSKYGGTTDCVCDKVFYVNDLMFDDKTMDILEKLKQSIKLEINDYNVINTDEKHTAKIAIRPSFKVRSTVGHVYDWYDCYFYSN